LSGGSLLSKLVTFAGRLFSNGAQSGELPDGCAAAGKPSFKILPFDDWDMKTVRVEEAKLPPFWKHPKGHPYQVFEGNSSIFPYEDRHKMQIWTNVNKLPGYKLVEDYYSDRPYLVWDHDAEERRKAAPKVPSVPSVGGSHE
jgi:hypothetical protein